MNQYNNQKREVYIIKEEGGKEVYIIKEMGGKKQIRQIVCGDNSELMPGILIRCANLTRLDVLKYSDYSLEKKTLENK